MNQRQAFSKEQTIMKTYLYDFDPLKPHLSGVYRGKHYFLISAQKHRLWVLVRTASVSRF